MDGVPFFIYLIMFEKNGNRLKECKKNPNPKICMSFYVLKNETQYKKTTSAS